MPDQTATALHGRGVLDIDTGDIIEPGFVRVEGNRIAEVGADKGIASDCDEVIELPELTLLPGFMDMEVNFFMGGPGAGLFDPVQTNPAKMTLRATANARRTLRAGFTTVRNLGLFVKTGGYLLDVALAEAIAAGWVDGPRIVPAGHAITPTGGHLDPTMFQALAPRRSADNGGRRSGRRHRRDSSSCSVPDQVRRPADQVLRFGRRDVAYRVSRRAAVFHRGVGRHCR